VHELEITVQAPSGGHELQHDETKAVATGVEVLLTLTRPGKDEMVMAALETKVLRVPLGPVQGRADVRVSTVERGVHYFVAPPYQLAATVELK
jgi:hypothetical protein